MRILFLVYHGFSEHSGISKKIHYQVKGLRENGHDVRLCFYDFAKNGHRCRFIGNDVLQDYGVGSIAAIRQRIDYNCIYDYCVREKIELVYATMTSAIVTPIRRCCDISASRSAIMRSLPSTS